MKVSCLGCAEFTFEIELDPATFRYAPVFSLTCPKCASSTALQQRVGGGVEIALARISQT